MKRVQYEYIINTTKLILYEKISTAKGLQNWFADMVTIENDYFIFTWNKNSSTAIIKKVELSSVSIFWKDEKAKSPLKLEIFYHELTNDLALLITDYYDDDETEIKDFWDLSITKLKRIIGDVK